MRPQKIPVYVLDKRKKFHDWIHSKDYISMPIYDLLGTEEHKKAARLSFQRRKSNK